MMARQLLLALCCLSNLALSQGTPKPDDCRASPGADNWPSEYRWQQLNETLNGTLLAVSPLGAVCHPDQPTYNVGRCAVVAEQWTSYRLHADDATSVAGDLFSNFSCLPNPEYSCSGGSAYPAYVVNASTAAHVKAGVDFARKYYIRLIVKNTGHDYLGRSVGPGALSIWLHHMKDIKYHPKAFFIQRADTKRKIPGNAMTVGGGVQHIDLYRAADRYNQTVVAGRPDAASVGYGGYVTGGGTSFFSPSFGMAADHIVQMEVVTADGDILTVNDDRHSDLFWALRGGGGSTFGVVTKFTLWTYPTPNITVVTWMATTSHNISFFWQLSAFLASTIPTFTQAGLSGLYTIIPTMANPDNTTGAPKEIGAVTGYGIIWDADKLHIVRKLFRQLNYILMRRWSGMVTLAVQTQQFPTLLAWYENASSWEGAGRSEYRASWILDLPALVLNEQSLARALQAASGPFGNSSITLMTGPGRRNVAPPGRGNAVHTAWRKGYVLASSSIVVPNKAAEKWAIKALDESFQPLRNLAPETGSYVNEGLPFEQNWQYHFWGKNHRRLAEIKFTTDSGNLFWCPGCVGNDHWRQRDDGRLCRV